MKSSFMSSLPLLFLSLLIFLSLPWPSLSAERCHPHDKKVLLKIKKALNNVPYYFSSWDPKTDCCDDWYGVFCDDLSTNRTTVLVVQRSNISGQIPPEVGDLPYLQELVFHHLPNINGNIPSSITKLTHLRMLWLDFLNLTGSIPSFLTQLKNLDYLNLAYNGFTGSIPPSLSQLQNLGLLRLDRNKLTGQIPESFGKFTGNLSILYLSHNQLTGEVPRSLGNLKISEIDLSRNRLEGDASFLLSAIKTVQFVDLSRNMFEFDLSKVKFPSSLTRLDLNHNRIFGSLPKQLTSLQLQFLNVSYNRLCGKIPQGGQLQSPYFGVTSYFHNRCLCAAPLPDCK